MVAGPDEEIGSTVGSVAIREAAASADVALVLERARPSGALVIARKGMLQARIHVTGRAAHAGVEPEKGRSAVLAAAQAVVALHGLSEQPGGVTCTVGTFRGGTRPNVVAESATLDLDLRAVTADALVLAEAQVAAICERPAIEGVTMRLERLGRFPPMERSAGSERMLAVVKAVGIELGMAIEAVETGGASDANLVASMGVPVLDGLGPIGGEMHTPGENLDLATLPERVALLGGTLLALLHSPC